MSITQERRDQLLVHVLEMFLSGKGQFEVRRASGGYEKERYVIRWQEETTE